MDTLAPQELGVEGGAGAVPGAAPEAVGAPGTPAAAQPGAGL
jgi:hypothetical protein